jgi:hypothetical protein
VRFQGEVLWVRLDGDAAFYRARLEPLLRSARIGLTVSMAGPETKSAHEFHEHDPDHDGHTHGHPHDPVPPHGGEERA